MPLKLGCLSAFEMGLQYSISLCSFSAPKQRCFTRFKKSHPPKHSDHQNSAEDRPRAYFRWMGLKGEQDQQIAQSKQKDFLAIVFYLLLIGPGRWCMGVFCKPRRKINKLPHQSERIRTDYGSDRGARLLLLLLFSSSLSSASGRGGTQCNFDNSSPKLISFSPIDITWPREPQTSTQQRLKWPKNVKFLYMFFE